MNNKVIGIAAFLIGAAVGAIAARQYYKKKYEKQYREDVESVKATFSKTGNQIVKTDSDEVITDIREKAEKAKEKPSIMEYAKMVKEKGYTDYSAASIKEEEDAFESAEDFSEFEEVQITHDAPYVIAPEEFGTNEDYETVSLLYFADKVLTDENNEVLDDPDSTIGLDSLNHFGEYEEDSVFVRNDELRCDFEILLDLRNYSDVVKKEPRLVEVE